MPRRDPTADMLRELAASRTDPASAEATESLARALESKANIVVERAAELAAAGGHATLVPDLCAAFARLAEEPDLDHGCNGKVAIILALARLNFGGDEVLLAASRYVQQEFALGGSQDTAAELRAGAAVALAEKDHPLAVATAIRLLNDAEVRARLGGIRALVAKGTETAAMLLRYKALGREPDAEVVAECLSGLLRIDDTAVPFVAEFLEIEDDEIAGIAAMALGESGQSQALPALREAWDRLRETEAGSAVLLAIAMLRLDEGIDFLIDLVRDGDPHFAQAALAALSLYREQASVRQRVDEAVTDSGSRALMDAFRASFG